MSATNLSTNQGVFPLLADDALAIDTMVENFLISNNKDSCKPLASRICITALRAIEHFKDRNQAREEMNKMFNLMFLPKIKDIALLYATRTANVVNPGEEDILTYSRNVHYSKEADRVKNGDMNAIIRMFREETYERLGIETFPPDQAEADIKTKHALTTMGVTREVERVIGLFEKKFYNETIIESLLPSANRFHFNSTPNNTKNLMQDNKK